MTIIDLDERSQGSHHDSRTASQMSSALEVLAAGRTLAPGSCEARGRFLRCKLVGGFVKQLLVGKQWLVVYRLVVLLNWLVVLSLIFPIVLNNGWSWLVDLRIFFPRVGFDHQPTSKPFVMLIASYALIIKVNARY